MSDHATTTGASEIPLVRGSSATPRDDRGEQDVAVLLFDGVDVLDFAGPFEVFSVAGHSESRKLFRVYTVAERHTAVEARNGLRILPRYGFVDCPDPAVLVVPGGYGTRREIHNAWLIRWLRARAASADIVLSVCTGALLLGKARLLDGLTATTHRGALELLGRVAPRARIDPHARVVDNGKILVSGGIAAGNDLSLHVVARIYGRDVARSTAQYLEYSWNESVREGT